MSEHAIEVTKILSLSPHPNADNLEFAGVFGFQSLVAKGQYKVGDLVAFVIPDSIVDTSLEPFVFLADKAKSNGTHRIRAIKLRGAYSQGLIIPAPEGTVEGQDIAEMLNIKHYDPAEPQMQIPGQSRRQAPLYPAPEGIENITYDMENMRKFPKVLEGEVVVATEKLDGTNFRIVFTGGKLHVGSHRQWRNPDDPADYWWAMIKKNPNLISLAERYPDTVFFGEIYGGIGRLKYGENSALKASIVVFDAYEKGTFLDIQDLVERLSIFFVPTPRSIYLDWYDKDKLLALAERDSGYGGGISEGIVVRTLREIPDRFTRRKVLKIVSNAYLTLKEAKEDTKHYKQVLTAEQMF